MERKHINILLTRHGTVSTEDDVPYSVLVNLIAPENGERCGSQYVMTAPYSLLTEPDDVVHQFIVATLFGRSINADVYFDKPDWGDSKALLSAIAAPYSVLVVRQQTLEPMPEVTPSPAHCASCGDEFDEALYASRMCPGCRLDDALRNAEPRVHDLTIELRGESIYRNRDSIADDIRYVCDFILDTSKICSLEFVAKAEMLSAYEVPDPVVVEFLSQTDPYARAAFRAAQGGRIEIHRLDLTEDAASAEERTRRNELWLWRCNSDSIASMLVRGFDLDEDAAEKLARVQPEKWVEFGRQIAPAGYCLMDGQYADVSEYTRQEQVEELIASVDTFDGFTLFNFCRDCTKRITDRFEAYPNHASKTCCGCRLHQAEIIHAMPSSCGSSRIEFGERIGAVADDIGMHPGAVETFKVMLPSGKDVEYDVANILKTNEVSIDEVALWTTIGWRIAVQMDAAVSRTAWDDICCTLNSLVEKSIGIGEFVRLGFATHTEYPPKYVDDGWDYSDVDSMGFIEPDDPPIGPSIITLTAISTIKNSEHMRYHADINGSISIEFDAPSRLGSACDKTIVEYIKKCDPDGMKGVAFKYIDDIEGDWHIQYFNRSAGREPHCRTITDASLTGTQLRCHGGCEKHIEPGEPMLCPDCRFAQAEALSNQKIWNTFDAEVWHSVDESGVEHNTLTTKDGTKIRIPAPPVWRMSEKEAAFWTALGYAHCRQMDDIRKFLRHEVVGRYILLGKQAGQLVRRKPDDTSTQSQATKAPAVPPCATADGKTMVQVLDCIGKGSGRKDADIATEWSTLLSPLPLVGMNNPHELVRQLVEDFPWCAELNRQAAKTMALSAHAGITGTRLPPLLLVGPPGVGKTHWTRRVGEITQSPCVVFPGAGTGEALMMSGGTRQYESSQPCFPAVAMRQARAANPLIVVDEVDKGGEGAHGVPLESVMLSFLEKSSSTKYYDRFLMGTLDASCVNWVMTANTLDTLSEPFLSRVRILHFPAPKAEHYPALLASATRELAKRYGLQVDGLPKLSDKSANIIERAFGRDCSPRLLCRRLEDAMSDAVMGFEYVGRDEDSINGKRSIGFY